MLTYLLLGLWISSTIGSPIQPQNSGPLVYYSPAGSHSHSEYVQRNVYPFVQYPNESPAFGKALQSVSSQNELLFYPNPAVLPQQIQQQHVQQQQQQQQQQQSFIINTQPGNLHHSRFTAPPSGLVDAIYAWFAENNIPVPDDPSKNDASLDIKDQENTEKTAGEAEILAEADKNPNFNFPKKPIGPKFHPGQRFYILNGQPQFFGNYQPQVQSIQPAVPQFLTRSSIPTEGLYLQQRKQDNLQAQTVQEQTNQNLVLLQEQAQADVKPVRYSSDLKPQNYILFRNQQQQDPLQVQQFAPYSRQQQLLIGRLLPQGQDKQQVQTPDYQTHYVPVEVVPPQAPQYYQPQENEQPQLAFIHIPVDRNVQPPQHITRKAPQQQQQQQQQTNQGNQYLYLSPESQQIQQRFEANEQNLQQVHQPDNKGELAPGIAALEFVRYIESGQGDLYSDSVVIDAKSDEGGNKEEEEEDSAQNDEPQEPSIAQAQPSGISLAGPGGVAASSPRGTAYVGDKGLAVASPQATAVAGPHPSKDDKNRRN